MLFCCTQVTQGLSCLSDFLLQMIFIKAAKNTQKTSRISLVEAGIPSSLFPSSRTYCHRKSYRNRLMESASERCGTPVLPSCFLLPRGYLPTSLYHLPLLGCNPHWAFFSFTRKAIFTHLESQAPKKSESAHLIYINRLWATRNGLVGLSALSQEEFGGGRDHKGKRQVGLMFTTGGRTSNQ